MSVEERAGERAEERREERRWDRGGEGFTRWIRSDQLSIEGRGEVFK